MKTQLIAAALVCASAALSSPAFAQDASADGAQSYGRSNAAPQTQRTGTLRRAYIQTRIEPAFFSDGWIGASGLDRSRPGSFDPDLRPAAN